MRIIYGLGYILSLLLVSCWFPLPPASISQIELVYVWDADILSDYEEMQINFDLFSYAQLSKVYLTSPFYNDVFVEFPAQLLQLKTGIFQGQLTGIRFSYFDKYLPRGVYTLTLVGRAGQEEKLNFYLEGSYCDFDWGNFFSIEEGKLRLSEKVEWRNSTERGRNYYRSKWQGKSLLIKDFSP